MEATEATVDKNNFVGNLNLPSREKYLMHTTDQIKKKKKIPFFLAYEWNVWNGAC